MRSLSFSTFKSKVKQSCFTVWMILPYIVSNAADSAVLVQEMKGTHFTIPISHTPPSMFVSKTGNGTYIFKGTSIDAAMWLAASLNITFALNQEDEESKYGIVQTFFNRLLRNEIDAIFIALIPTVNRMKDMDFSFPVVFMPYRFMVPWPSEESRLLAPIRPFQSTVWIWIAIVLVSMILSSSCLMGLYKKCIESSPGPVIGYSKLSTCAIYVVSILTNQGIYIMSKQASLRISVGIWCLMAVILINGYAGNLVSYLAVPKMKPIIQSINDLATNEEIKLAIDMNSVMADRFLNARSGPEKQLGDMLRQDSQALIRTRAGGVKTMLSLKYAYLGFEQLMPDLLKATLKESKCSFTVSKQLTETSAQFLSYGYRKGGRFNKVMDYKLMQAIEMGLINYWMMKHVPRVDQCLLNKKDSRPKQRSLLLGDLSSVFAALAIGLGIAVLTFMVERIYSTCVNPSKKHVLWTNK